MRNVDKIKVLETKLEHQNELVKQLRKENAMLRDGAKAFSLACDTLMAGVAMTYGETREDEGEIIGYRMPVDRYDSELLREWEIRVEEQEGQRVVGIIKKDL